MNLELDLLPQLERERPGQAHLDAKNPRVRRPAGIVGNQAPGGDPVEAIACLAAIEHQTLPPTINLDSPDHACPIIHVTNHACLHPVTLAVSNSFGFGGSNTCLALRAI